MSGGAPDSPVCHQTVTVDGPVRISFLFWRRRPLHLGVDWRIGHCPVHTGQSGAPGRPLERVTRRPRVARPTVALAVVGSPDSPVRHRTVTVDGPVRISFLSTTVAPRRRLAHRTLSGAHRTVQCPLPTVGADHVPPTDFAADRCAVDRWLTGQSGAPPDSPVNFCRTPLNVFRE